jgi:hypothetical protein
VPQSPRNAERRTTPARKPKPAIAVLLLDVDPENALGGWLAKCWVHHFEILERFSPEPGTEWTFRLVRELRDIHQYFEGAYRSYKTFHSSDSIDPKIWFEWYLGAYFNSGRGRHFRPTPLR